MHSSALHSFFFLNIFCDSVESSFWVFYLKFALKMICRQVSGTQCPLAWSKYRPQQPRSNTSVWHCFSWLHQTQNSSTAQQTELTFWIYGQSEKSLFFFLTSQDLNKMWIYSFFDREVQYMSLYVKFQTVHGSWNNFRTDVQRQTESECSYSKPRTSFKVSGCKCYQHKVLVKNVAKLW